MEELMKDLAALLDKHGTAAVLEGLADACEVFADSLPPSEARTKMGRRSKRGALLVASEDLRTHAKEIVNIERTTFGTEGQELRLHVAVGALAHNMIEEG